MQNKTVSLYLLPKYSTRLIPGQTEIKSIDRNVTDTATVSKDKSSIKDEEEERFSDERRGRKRAKCW